MDSEPLLVETGKGLSIKYKNRYIYSKYDPFKSIIKLIENIKLNEKTIYLIPSPLLGYGISEIQDLLPKNSILLLVEIDLKLYDITQNKENVSFISNGFEFIDILKDINYSGYKKCEILNLNGSYDLYKSNYDRLFKILLNQLHNHWKNRFTLTKMGQLWIKNSLKNLNSLNNSSPLNQLKTDKPVVVIGAGESTESILAILKENRPKIFILCVDTALQILIEYNIKPDCVVALEGQFYNLPDFYGVKDYEIDLIYDLSSYPAVLRNLKGNKYYTVTQFSDSSFFDLLKKNDVVKNFLPPLGSVGITAIYIALQITNNFIFLSGLDFSYTLGKTHSNGTPYHLSNLCNWSRLNPGDSFIQCLKRPLLSKKNKVDLIENTDSILYEYSLHAKELLLGTDRVFDLTRKGMDLGISYVNSKEFNCLIENRVEPILSDHFLLKNKNIQHDIFYNILDAIKYTKLFFDNNGSFEDVKSKLLIIDYLFDHYPESQPLNSLNESNIKRFYLTLLRYKRILGLNN